MHVINLRLHIKDNQWKEVACLQANRSVSDTAAINKLLADGEEAASFIRTFVVQAKLNDRGNFRKLTFHM